MKSAVAKFFSFFFAVLLSTSITNAQFTKLDNPVMGGLSLYQLGDGGAAWGDYDADGDMDLALNGRDNSFVAHLIIYQNNGDGTFSVADADTAAGTFLIGLDSGGISWGDVDNDGDLDLIQTGFNDDPSPQRKTILYGNNNGSFSPLVNPVDGTGDFLGTDDFNPNWVDYDHDGDQDIFYVDEATGDLEKGVLYTNNGDNTFTRNLTPVDGVSNFEGHREADAVWGDYNNDGYIDLYVQGASGFQGINSTLYKNNGDGTFSLVKRGEDPTTFFSGTRLGANDFVDYDADGDLDLFYTGETRGNSRRGDLYANNGDDTFSFVANIGAGFRGFIGVLGSGASWGDYDGDGDSDMVYGGFASTSRIVKLYSYQGLNDFDELFNPVDGTDPFEGISARAAIFGDYDGDGDLDVLTAGTRSDFTGVVNLYENTSNHTNTVPTAPTNLQFKRTPTGVEFSWDMPTDDATPSLGLNYEIRVGTTPGGKEIMAPLSITSGPNEGSRLIPYRGAIQGTSTNLMLSNGTYYWSVQAIDAGHNGSAFAAEQMIEVTDFVVPPPNAFVLLSPENGTDTLSQTPARFIWQKTSDPFDHADSLWYTFELSDDSLFTNKLDSAFQKGDTSYATSLQLNPGGYFWRVSATNSSDSTTWGSDSDITPFTFKIKEPFVPTPPSGFELLSPADQTDTLTSTPALFVWQKATDENESSENLVYTFELSDQSDFSNKLDSASVTGDTTYTTSAALFTGAYFWRVSATNSLELTSWGSGSDANPFAFTIVEMVSNEQDEELPLRFSLEQNYPNPFNPGTNIEFSLASSSSVTLEVFNILGTKVATLIDGAQMNAGSHYSRFDASALASGIYLYRLEAGSFIQTRKMMLIK
ncbi:MAG: T9SS type A sorting domain-containing protein [Balneolaceae bacterium]|nr:T9SS type A sorting domain-containing protein [Balneolaceae bacterium]MBO6546069.1 T9SS type A sorting domain-containing protein [Balneolaceae bacterium]MBO6647465.1 T9SS type A sorting domain-containing protein [Balneolaceae bacterium]